MTRWARLVVGAVLAAFMLGGCAGSNGGSTPSTSSAPSDLAADDGCRTPDGGRTDSWSVAGGVTLRALVVAARSDANARTAIVVSNASGQTPCAWLPYLALLRPYGTVWLYDYILGGTGLDDTQAVVTRALDTGAQRLILVGASMGAKLSLVAAASLSGPDVLGVVGLSPEAALSDGTPVLGRIRTARFPTLLLTAADDAYEAAPACRAFVAARPSVTTLRVLPGSAHGTALLTGPTGTAATTAVRRFLDAHH